MSSRLTENCTGSVSSARKTVSTPAPRFATRRTVDCSRPTYVRSNSMLSGNTPMSGAAPVPERGMVSSGRHGSSVLIVSAPCTTPSSRGLNRIWISVSPDGSISIGNASGRTNSCRSVEALDSVRVRLPTLPIVNVRVAWSSTTTAPKSTRVTVRRRTGAWNAGSKSLRMRLLPVSTTIRLPSGSRTTRVGSRSSASAAGPPSPADPKSPVPARVKIFPVTGSTARTRLLPVSDI